ncbi:MAG TPA: redoxin domain-containing protein [Saprospiraceae bacterium]|nr:redoxin domain-containing protein [Saprospiraceae bacterium]HPQ20670.1 redoxin domain-containing protein [Saprospiraceae bacterium]HRX28029.1 redoxin domain-containing protein [Saprospiraceae bacterium]
MIKLVVGDFAPNFNLINSDKEAVSLDDFKGNDLLILFFPLAFTSVCTAELCSLRDDKSYFQNLGVKTIAISVDSPFVLNKFKEENQLNFPLLSDFNKEASRAYGCMYEQFVLGLRGVSKRSAFLIDKLGKIKYAEVLENAGELPNFSKIKSLIEGKK